MVSFVKMLFVTLQGAKDTLANIQIKALYILSFCLKIKKPKVMCHQCCVAGNDLTVFNMTVFSMLRNLQLLDLSNNDIEDVDGNITADLLPQLVSLSLHGNEIETLPGELEPVFSRLHNLTLHDNPLHCNCELRWLAKWLERGHNRYTG